MRAQRADNNKVCRPKLNDGSTGFRSDAPGKNQMEMSPILRGRRGDGGAVPEIEQSHPPGSFLVGGRIVNHGYHRSRTWARAGRSRTQVFLTQLVRNGLISQAEIQFGHLRKSKVKLEPSNSRIDWRLMEGGKLGP